MEIVIVGGHGQIARKLGALLAARGDAILFSDADLATPIEELAKLRREQARPWEDYTIGCILLVEPFFWPQELWIPQPADFSGQIVRGKGYDLTAADFGGERLEGCNDYLVVTRPDVIAEIHRGFLEAGAEGKVEKAANAEKAGCCANGQCD